MFGKFVQFAVVAVTSLLFAMPALARDSVFDDYDSYAEFVDTHIMNRDFVRLIQTLGGRDEYTPEELDKIQSDFLRAFPRDFREKFVFLSEDLGGGMRREARGYHRGERYVWFYAIMHQRENDLVVINFRLNTSITRIMDAF